MHLPRVTLLCTSEEDRDFPRARLTSYSVLSFLLVSGAADQAAAWAALSADTKAAIKTEYNAAGVSVIVSAFGATDAPTSGGVDPVATANAMAQFVLDNQLDGIDVDYEVQIYPTEQRLRGNFLLTPVLGPDCDERARRRRGGVARIVYSDTPPEAAEGALPPDTRT